MTFHLSSELARIIAAPFRSHPRPPSEEAEGSVATLQRIWRLLAFLGLASVPAWIGHSAVAHAASLHELAAGPSPYFVPEHAFLLYLWTPLVVAGASVFLMAPGLLLAIALNRSGDPWRWVSAAFALSCLSLSAATAAVQQALGRPVTAESFLSVVAACTAASAAAALWRVSRGNAPAWPFHGRPWCGLTLLGLPPVLTLILLSPKFYWEAFNGDGAHAFECARLLLFRPLPFWPSAAGGISSYPGFNTMAFAYPASWYLRLFGPLEASARLPLLPALAALYAGILSLIEHQAGSVRGVARWTVWAGLSVFILIMAFSATYDPYLADIASPFAQDVEHLAFFLGFILALLRSDSLMMALCLVLTCLSSAGGTLCIVLTLVSAALVLRVRPWKSIAWAAVCSASLALLLGTAAAILAARGAPLAQAEHGLAQLIVKFRYIQLTDWRRIFSFLVLPTGILPAVVLAACWRRFDDVARLIACFTLLYFSVFYVQLFTSQHYYVPAMVLPLIPFWRSAVSRRPWAVPAVVLGSFVGLLAAWPDHPRPVTASREVGRHLENRVGGYEPMAAEAFLSSELMDAALPYDWYQGVPTRTFGGSPLAWNYYAQRPRGPGIPTYYVIQPASGPAPPGARLHARRHGYHLYILDEQGWSRHRALAPSSPAGSSFFAVRPRNLMFFGADARGGPPVLDLKLVFDWLIAKLRPLGGSGIHPG